MAGPLVLYAAAFSLGAKRQQKTMIEPPFIHHRLISFPVFYSSKSFSPHECNHVAYYRVAMSTGFCGLMMYKRAQMRLLPLRRLVLQVQI